MLLPFKFLLVADKHTMDPFAPALVNVQNVESIEDPELLLLTFKILVSLSGHYPEYFKNFKVSVFLHEDAY